MERVLGGPDLGLQLARMGHAGAIMSLRSVVVEKLVQLGPRLLTCRAEVGGKRTYTACLDFGSEAIHQLFALACGPGDCLASAVEASFFGLRPVYLPPTRADLRATLGVADDGRDPGRVPLVVSRVEPPSASAALEILTDGG